MQKFNLPYTDLLNKARLEYGLPAIPYSEWETAIKNLQKTDPEKYKQILYDPVAGEAQTTSRRNDATTS